MKDREQTTLDDNPQVTELITQIHNGNHEHAARIMWKCSPHIAASVILELCGIDERADACRLVNRLIDHFLEWRESQ